jgi:hypothetical protein
LYICELNVPSIGSHGDVVTVLNNTEFLEHLSVSCLIVYNKLVACTMRNTPLSREDRRFNIGYINGKPIPMAARSKA